MINKIKNYIKRKLAKFLYYEIKMMFGKELYNATIEDDK